MPTSVSFISLVPSYAFPYKLKESYISHFLAVKRNDHEQTIHFTKATSIIMCRKRCCQNTSNFESGGSRNIVYELLNVHVTCIARKYKLLKSTGLIWIAISSNWIANKYLGAYREWYCVGVKRACFMRWKTPYSRHFSTVLSIKHIYFCWLSVIILSTSRPQINSNLWFWFVS